MDVISCFRTACRAEIFLPCSPRNVLKLLAPIYSLSGVPIQFRIAKGAKKGISNKFNDFQTKLAYLL